MNLVEHEAKRHRSAPNEKPARIGGGDESGRLVLGGDGGKHGRLAPSRRAVPQLNPDGDVVDGVEPGGSYGERRDQWDVQRPSLRAADVNGECFF